MIRETASKIGMAAKLPDIPIQIYEPKANFQKAYQSQPQSVTKEYKE